jgi:hypothetical protein
MAKLSGFFMSTLLILLCLWINVCHYPDATRGAASDGSNDADPKVVAPPDAPASAPSEEKTNEQDSAAPSGLFADVAPAPELLDVSADPAATQPVLEPASFPGDGAEIDDAPRKKADVATPNEQNSNAAPQTAPASAAPRRESQTASPAVATPTQDVRRSETKPSGAKYVRVPESEIDAFSGGVRSARSTNDESRVVRATRAGQTKRAASPAL